MADVTISLSLEDAKVLRNYFLAHHYPDHYSAIASMSVDDYKLRCKQGQRIYKELDRAIGH